MRYGATYLVFLTPKALNVTPGNLIHGICHMVLDFVLSVSMFVLVYVYTWYNLPVSPRFAAVS